MAAAEARPARPLALHDAGLLAAAAEGILDEDEQRAPAAARRGGWSDADLPLLDEAHALLDGAAAPYGHVIVDEAQDLTPMQLRMLARRARGGALTILGDIAQATGPIAYHSWDEVLAAPRDGGEARVEELRLAYRVPREIMELALPLLDADRAGRRARRSPTATGDEPPRFAAGRRGRAPARGLPRGGAAGARGRADRADRPGRARRAGAQRTRARSTSIPLLTPRAAKGLEFDHVVVVEPALIAERATRGCASSTSR